MENKLNSGAIFRNNYKSEGDSKPDYKGKIDVDGKAKEIALWVRTDKNGAKYFSVKISEPYHQQPDQVPPPISEQGGTAATVTNQVDDLPF